MTSTLAMDWLLDSDPAIRWQVLRDLTESPAQAELFLADAMRRWFESTR